MGREIRFVTKNWKHPKDIFGNYKPLKNRTHYLESLSVFMGDLVVYGMQYTLENNGNPPNLNDYMPDFNFEDEERFLMMYENTSEGTPLSPAFETPEWLAMYLSDNNVSVFAEEKLTYKEWLTVIVDCIRREG